MPMYLITDEIQGIEALTLGKAPRLRVEPNEVAVAVAELERVLDELRSYRDASITYARKAKAR